MKKFSSSYLLYTLQIFFIGLFVLVLIGYNLQIAEKSFLENRMFSKNVKGIHLSEYQSPEDVDLIIPEINGEFMLYRNLAEGIRENIRGVYATSDVFGLSDYISAGRFFESSDFANLTQTVVVGSGILPITFLEDGVRYYAYNQKMYEVIGVFESTGTALDVTIYLNLPNLLQYEDNIGLYFVDASDSATVNSVIQKMNSNAEGQYSTRSVEYESTYSYEMSRMYRTLFMFSFLAAFFSLMITTIFFVSRQKYMVSIQKLCGMTKGNLIFGYSMRNLLITLTSFVLIVAAMFFLSQFENSVFSIKTLTHHHYIVTGIFLLALSATTTFFTIRLAEGVNISDTLKGR